MLSLIMIHALNQAQAQRAADEHLYPLVVEAEDKRSGDRLVTHLRRIPNLGSHRPAGWTLGRTLFVDASHQGRRGASALTFVQFLTEVQVGCGYAILQAGTQCQVGGFTRQVSRTVPTPSPDRGPAQAGATDRGGRRQAEQDLLTLYETTGKRKLEEVGCLRACGRTDPKTSRWW